MFTRLLILLFSIMTFQSLTGCTPQRETLIVTEEETVTVQKMTLEADEFFAFNSATLSDSARLELDQVIAAIRVTPAPFVYITGHADYLGSSEANETLSRQRAEEVADYIQAGAGLLDQSIIARGMSFRQPLVDCFAFSGEAEKDCLAPNRRVEVYYTANAIVETDTVTVVSRISEGTSSIIAVETAASRRVTPIGG